MKLKPCPFCGGEPIEFVHKEGFNKTDYSAHIVCRGCGASTKPYIGTKRFVTAGVRTDWNKRVNPCEECPIAQNTNLEDDDSPCRDCGVGE